MRDARSPLIVGVVVAATIAAVAGLGNEISAHADDRTGMFEPASSATPECETAPSRDDMRASLRSIVLWWRPRAHGCIGRSPTRIPDGGRAALDDLTTAMSRLDAATDHAARRFSGSSDPDETDPQRVTIWLVCATLPAVPRIVTAETIGWPRANCDD
ncbi:hypothetical protein [Gordonia insulae]|uniref:Uncharacterized protein n=1 Tax=Gordonia insulae TaxID=2420509 RepID=A0A3G8JMF5_9ACTN|nr:hypothetical protein [Gordonia insulae]AZG45629.1 hypothetical protein D7316_02225 [Gordonia insulae]